MIIRPYINLISDKQDAVNMVWHDYVFVQFDKWVMG